MVTFWDRQNELDGCRFRVTKSTPTVINLWIEICFYAFIISCSSKENQFPTDLIRFDLYFEDEEIKMKTKHTFKIVFINSSYDTGGICK